MQAKGHIRVQSLVRATAPLLVNRNGDNGLADFVDVPERQDELIAKSIGLVKDSLARLELALFSVGKTFTNAMQRITLKLLLEGQQMLIENRQVCIAKHLGP